MHVNFNEMLTDKKQKLRMLGVKLDNMVASGTYDIQDIIELQREYNNLLIQVEAEDNYKNKKIPQWQLEAASNTTNEPK